MNTNSKTRPFPRGALIGAALLIGFSLALALFGRLSGMGASRTSLDPAVETRDVLFEQRSDGAIAVLDPRDRSLIKLVTPGRDGFIEVVMRGLNRTRMLAEVEERQPYRLARHHDGRLSIIDPATGQHIGLGAFGADNAASFAQLLETGRRP